MKHNWIDMSLHGSIYEVQVDANAGLDAGPSRFRHRERAVGDGRPYQHGRTSFVADWKRGPAPDHREKPKPVLANESP